MTPIVGQWTLGLYALILAVGGVIGSTKARTNRAFMGALIGGVGGALSAILAILLANGGFVKIGFTIGVILALMLTGTFAMRVFETRKLMPSGVLVALSLVVLVVMGMVLARL